MKKNVILLIDVVSDGGIAAMFRPKKGSEARKRCEALKKSRN